MTKLDSLVIDPFVISLMVKAWSYLRSIVQFFFEPPHREGSTWPGEADDMDEEQGLSAFEIESSYSDPTLPSLTRALRPVRDCHDETSKPLPVYPCVNARRPSLGY